MRHSKLTFIVLLLSSFLPSLCHAQKPIGVEPVYELACPSPYQPLAGATTIDVQTGKLRAYGCLNEQTGRILWQADELSPGGDGKDAVTTPLRVNGIDDGNDASSATSNAGILGALTVGTYANTIAGQPTISLSISGSTGSSTYVYEVREYPYLSTQMPSLTSSESPFHSAMEESTVTDGPSTLSSSNKIIITIGCVSKFDTVIINKALAPAGAGIIEATDGSGDLRFFSCATGTVKLTDDGTLNHSAATTWYDNDTSGIIRASGIVPNNYTASNAESLFTSEAGTGGEAGIGQLIQNGQFTWSPAFYCTGASTTAGCLAEGTLTVNGDAEVDGSLWAKGGIEIGGSISYQSGSYLHISGGTFADLPTSPKAGATVYITDGDGTSTCSGGGTVTQIAIYNGTSWSCH